MNRLDELLARWQDGSLAAPESEELARLLESPGARERLVDDFFTIQTLREVLGAAATGRGARAPRKRRTWSLVAAAAAAAAIGLGALLYLREAPIGEVVRAKGTVLPGAGKVYARGWLETAGPGSAATIRFSDGTTADLNGGTKLGRIEEGRLELAAGTLTVETARPIMVVTPQAEARVLGTVFKVSVARDATRLEVKKGEVRVTRREDGASASVKADHYAVVARGPAPSARPLASLVAKMAPNTWLSVPDTALRTVTPAQGQFPGTWGLTGPRAVIDAWGGGALDARRNRLVLWGGGHTNYAGNEVYAFDIEAMAWERVTDPSVNPVDGGAVNPDGTPAARATYNGLAYVAHADRLFASGGDLFMSKNRPGEVPALTWLFDFSTRRWTDAKPSGNRPPNWVGDCCAYDPETRKVWWGESHDRGPGLYSYDPAANVWTRHNSDRFYYQTGAIDSRRGLLVVAGNGAIFAYDLRRGAFARQEWRTTGGDAFIAKSNPGLDYDPAHDRIVGWAGGAVWALDPERKTWTAVDAPGAPDPTPNGIFGRWRYVPALRAFIVATGIDANVHFFRFAN